MFVWEGVEPVEDALLGVGLLVLRGVDMDSESIVLVKVRIAVGVFVGGSSGVGVKMVGERAMVVVMTVGCPATGMGIEVATLGAAVANVGGGL